MINFFNALIKKFVNTIALRLSLKERTVLRLRKPTVTRWNSIYLMLERLNDMKAASVSVGESHDQVKVPDDLWVAMNDILYILKPFYTC